MKLSKYFPIALLCLTTLAHGYQKSSTFLKGLHENIPMGKIDGVELSINIAFPEKTSVKPRPVMLMIHGGGLSLEIKALKTNRL